MDDGYVLIIESKEVVSEGGRVMSAAGQRYYVHSGGEGWGWDTGIAYDPGRPFPKRTKIFASRNEARVFAEQWEGHPWWVQPNGRYEIVGVKGLLGKEPLGYEVFNEESSFPYTEFKERFAGHFVDRQTGLHYYLGTGMHKEIQEVLAWAIDKPFLKNTPKFHEGYGGRGG